MSLANLGIGKKLQLSFGVITLLTAVVGGVALTSLASVDHEAEELGNNWLPSVKVLGEISYDVQQFRREQLAHIITQSPAEMREQEDRLADTLKEMNGDLARYEKLISEPEEKRLYNEFHQAWNDYLASKDKIMTASHAGIEKLTETMKLVNESRRPLHEAETRLKELIRINSEGALAANKHADESYRSARAWVIGVLAVVIALSIALALVITGLITTPLKEAMGAAQRIASGDLTTAITARGKDETGQLTTALAEMQNQLRALVAQLKDSAGEVSASSAQLSSSAGQVSQGTQTQSEAASSMAASVEEVTVSISHVSDNARDAQQLALESGRESAQGAEVINGAAAEMAKIADSVQASATLIQQLGQRSDQISAIVKTIKEIADQTNLLALNAAIEAARAGEQGRGFAVVADEVRQLAERTGKATSEISTMIDSIQQGTRTAVSAMESGVVQVKQGLSLANEAGNAINRIQSSAQQVVRVVEDISAALSEQSAASQEIARRVEQIAQMSEENSAAVGETADSAHHLEKLANSLQSTVARFRV